MGKRAKQQIDTTTNDTLFVAAWVEDDCVAITASLRTADGETKSGIHQATGPTLATLDAALRSLASNNARHCMVLTNDRELLRLLSFPWRYDKGPPMEWPAVYFRILSTLTSYCLAGTWSAKLAEDLPKARELWQQQQISK